MSGLLNLSGCASGPIPTTPTGSADRQSQVAVATDSLRLLDTVRNRMVPVTLYFAVDGATGKPQKVALLNHGYGGKNTEYSFVARTLVAAGYYVASVQHELPTDVPMPTTGNVYDVRKPYWERGVQNMRFVLRELQRRQPALDYTRLLLVGHSNGGDMVMLFAQEYPLEVDKVISLDNRRVALPRARRPPVLSLCSSDQVADAGVLPTLAEQQQWGTKIIHLTATKHDDMWDGATQLQRHEMQQYIAAFLQEPPHTDK